MIQRIRPDQCYRSERTETDQMPEGVPIVAGVTVFIVLMSVVWFLRWLGE